MTLDELRRFAVSHSLFRPTTLAGAIEKLGFVQADPIRSPARAQDLTLRHRVKGYRAGDLERLYARLPVEEDVLVNYGFVSRSVSALMHPRTKMKVTDGPRTKADKLLAFVRDRTEAHPREVDAHFSHGTVTNYWGGTSNATTHLLEHLHYRGWLRVARRERGIRIYAFRESAAADGALSPRQRVDALVDVAVNKYAPLPALSLSYAVGRLRYAVPQWRALLKGALARAKERFAQDRVDGVDWFGVPTDPSRLPPPDAAVRLLAPFDPIVWDRRRFELFWGWPYRFEAYTPLAKRKFGYYALPMLWRDRVIGWGNLSTASGTLEAQFGYVASAPPRDRTFARELEAEVERIRAFLKPRRI